MGCSCSSTAYRRCSLLLVSRSNTSLKVDSALTHTSACPTSAPGCCSRARCSVSRAHWVAGLSGMGELPYVGEDVSGCPLYPAYSVPCSRARNSPTGSAKDPKCSDMMLLNWDAEKLPMSLPFCTTARADTFCCDICSMASKAAVSGDTDFTARFAHPRDPTVATARDPRSSARSLRNLTTSDWDTTLVTSPALLNTASRCTTFALG
mmetsp:Transcript_898/g.2755  ORF Transcript_898/g.2755 Transcript_898/m.2755 type:complete len:207 (+) Transcript_898:1287-1907(+)